MRANTVQLPRADLDLRAEMGPAWTGIAFWWGCFGLSCASMVPGGAESDLNLQGLIGTWGLLIFVVIRVQQGQKRERRIVKTYSHNKQLSDKVHGKREQVIEKVL